MSTVYHPENYSRVRRRGHEDFVGQQEIGRQRVIYRGKPIQDLAIMMYDHSHENWFSETTFDSVHKKGYGGVYHTGGPFVNFQAGSYPKTWNGFITSVGGSTQTEYEGTIYPRFSGCPGFSTTIDESEGEMDGYGAKAWNKYCPGKPKANLSVFLGELRDFPRMIEGLRKRSRTLKEAAGDYVNHEFGWAPFIRDIQDMYGLSQRIPAELEKIRRSNGKWLLREGSVETEKSVISNWSVRGQSAVAGFYPALPMKMYGDLNACTLSGSETMSRDVWFSGRFRYYIPEARMKTKAWKANTVRKLFGATLTPDVVYELVPWSWLYDYFADLGDVFANISGGYVDAVAKYAYVMGTTTYAQDQQSSFTAPDGTHVSVAANRSRIIKMRTAANPFGFDVKAVDLSAKQIAILIALGVNRFG